MLMEMRIFEFRAWHTLAGCMIEWQPLRNVVEGGEIMVARKMSIMDIKTDTAFPVYPSNVAFRIKGNIFDHPDLLIMQHTGLYDQDGKGIYENDICKIVTATRRLNIIGQIIYKPGKFLCKCKGDYNGTYIPDAFNGDEITIIGNVLENPELMAGC